MMEIIFSRHAKRRIRLYGLSEIKIREMITKSLEHSPIADGKIKMMNEGIKVILKVEKKEIVVITAYPFGKKV